jgi:Na+/proline symporter
MGWVNLAMAKIIELTLHVPKLEALGACLIFTAIYVMIGGLWGVLVTDLLQFVVKMTMAIVLAVAAVAAVGGIGDPRGQARGPRSRRTASIRAGRFSRSFRPRTPRGCRC